MSEHIISDEFIKGVRDASYEAGKAGLESYIVGVEYNEEVIRCRECKWFGPERSDHEYRSPWWCGRWLSDRVSPEGYCAWAERRQA